MDLSITGDKDSQLVRSDWEPVGQPTIEGVVAKQVANVIAAGGYLTEMWRADWALDAGGVGQVFQRVLDPGTISAWHVHLATTDRLFCAFGRVRTVLYDARQASPTHGTIVEYRYGDLRPAVISVPPGVYHGVQNIGPDRAVLMNAVDEAYAYEDPDHHRVPQDLPEIPFTW